MAYKTRTEKRKTKHWRVRAKISGTKQVPRLTIFKSNKYIEVQIIDDTNGHTIAHSSSLSLKLKNGANIAAAKLVASDISKKMKDKGVKTIVFDRSGYVYHGKIKALAEAVRAEGVKF